MGQRRKDRELHWRGVLKQQASSGLSVASFCRQEAVSAPSFYSWRRKLRERDRAENKRDNGAATAVSRRQLLPVHIESSTPAPPVRILLPHGVSIETSGSVDEGALAHLLRALREAAVC